MEPPTIFKKMEDRKMLLVNYFSEHGDNELFCLSRGQRKGRYTEIIIEVLRKLADKPLTKFELQKLVKIRKKIFIRILNSMVLTGAVLRFGEGTKGSPFLYILAEKHNKKE